MLYRAALASHPGYTEARSALLRLYDGPEEADSLVSLAEAWTEPDAAAPVNDAILHALAAEGTVQQPVADRLLAVLGRNLAAAGMDPETFGRDYRERVRAVAAARPLLGPAANALADAYAPRGKGERYRKPVGAKWWTDPFARRSSRAQSWSTTLRQVGDRYYRAGEEATAASYYEAALDYPDSYGPPGWVDLGALLPLGVIYLHRSSAGGDRATIEALDRYIEFIFMGKSERYGQDDIRQVRAFHMALGELFAQRGEWAGKGPRNVIFQLERMRWATRRLRQEGEPEVFDPPELLERLATAYQKTGQPEKAKAVAGEARDAYRRLGRPADAARMDTLAAPPTSASLLICAT